MDNGIDKEALEAKLSELMSEHRDLDEMIARVNDGNSFDQLQMQRLKKRKLVLRDQIIRIESILIDDIIA
ncbi:MAG: hypothetical protein Alpg2KO_12120 [Alphaproteobacteria bacterium]